MGCYIVSYEEKNQVYKINLAQIEYFLAVAEKLNFTEAAKALYISQPSLSKQIGLLEEELGFHRFCAISAWFV